MLHATAAGNLGKDAELRQVGGSTVLNFSVATTSGFGERKQTNWINCAVWGERGNALAQYLTKGTAVVAVGELSTREHNGKTYLEMRVSELKLQGGQQQAPAQQQYAPTAQQQQYQPQQPAPAPQQQYQQQPVPAQYAPMPQDSGMDADIPF